MKTKILIAFLGTVFLLLTASMKFHDGKFKVFIVQGDQRYEVKYDDQVIELKRESFTIEVQLMNLDGIHASNSFQRDYYDTPLTERFRDWALLCFGAKTFAEEEDNADKDIFVDQEALSYWWYDPKDDFCRFDKGVKIIDGVVIGTITVNKLVDGDTRKSISLRSVKSPIYMTFFSSKEIVKGESYQELERKRVVVKFK